MKKGTGGWSVAIGMATGITLVGLVVALSPGPSSSTRVDSKPRSSRLATDHSIEGIVISRPFLNARSMSLSDTQGTVGFNIPRPNDPLGSDKLISNVWVDTSSGEVQIQLDYTTGLSVEIEPAGQGLASSGDQLAFFQNLAAQDSAQTHGLAAVTSVNGLAALLVPENSTQFANGQSQNAPGEVEFVLSGRVVDVFGHFSNDDLLRVASTVIGRPA